MKLLIIGRFPALRAGLPSLLTDGGCHVRVSHEPHEVGKALHEATYDVVLVEAPAAGGGDRLRAQIRRLQPTSRIVFVSPSDSNPAPIPDAGPGSVTVGLEDFAGLLRSATGEPNQDRPGEHRVRCLIQAMDVVVSLLESEDPYFAGFARRVAELADDVARRMKLDGAICEEIAIASLLRDLGKVGLSRTLLDEPGTLSSEDSGRMQSHITWTGRLLAHVEFPASLRAIMRHHHERYDGSGYPDGLSGRQIPVGARIIAAAEAFVAMISDRRHRPARSMTEAREELMRCAGTQFDPEVVEMLFFAIAQIQAVGGSGGRPTVLIADPDVAFRRMLAFRLHDEGIDSVLRGSLDDVEVLLRNRPPEVLIADVDALGSSSVQQLRSIASRFGLVTPVVALVESAGSDFRARVSKLAADDVITKDSDLESIIDGVKAVLLRATKTRDGAGAEPQGISGSLGSMELPDISQFLLLGVKTAKVELHGKDGTLATIWFDDGAITHAVCGDRVGIEAFNEALGITDGGFRITHGLRADVRSIRVDATSVLMDGVRLLDERRAATRQDAAAR